MYGTKSRPYNEQFCWVEAGMDATKQHKKAQLTQGLRATAPSFQDGRARQLPSWILSNRK